MLKPNRFVGNSFGGRSEFKDACVSLLESLKPYQSDGGARISLPIATSTHFDATAAQLEGFARPLWAVAALVQGKCLTDEETKELVEPYVRGLANGTDPAHPEYWGPVGNKDQRMVEMEIISFALLAAPDEFFHGQSPQAQSNISAWLKAINEKDMPVTNWLWFRVMTNLALTKVCGVPYDELQDVMNHDLDTMDRFYLGDGWSADGLWDENGRQADYYSGSFAIQFSQLLYAKMARDLDPVRCARFEERAVAFASSFWRYFNVDGACIPFGRSLTYRFAFAAFWSAAAFASINFPTPLKDVGVVKHLLLQHFLWWSKQLDIFSSDGTLSIGFCYPNMYMCEDYNSPQSPYWAMKSFVALALPENHRFWSAPEQAIHDDYRRLAVAVKPPMQIVCSSSNHHFLLSSGQFCPWPLKATEAKYGKYAYSSTFGFSVPTGSLLPQIAPDSTMALSKDGGDTWRLPWKTEECSFSSARLFHRGNVVEEIPVLVGLWRPWRDADVVVRTALIAPSSRWPDWYIRVHLIQSNDSRELQLDVVEGGFAIPLEKDTHSERGIQTFADSTALFEDPAPIGVSTAPTSAVSRSLVGAGGIRRLGGDTPTKNVVGSMLKPDANTNLMWQKTLIPIITSTALTLQPNAWVVFASGVFAVVLGTGQTRTCSVTEAGKGWADSPKLCVDGHNLSDTGNADVIDFEW